MSSFNYHSQRARKARFAARVRKFMPVAKTLTVILLLVSIGLLVFSFAAGWLVLGLTMTCSAFIFWWNQDLWRIAIIPGDAVDGRMSSSVLGLLPENPSVADVAEAIARSQSERFLALRFGITGVFLTEIAKNTTADAETLWRNADGICKTLGTEIISGGVLALAIVQTVPNYEQFLAQIRMEFGDLLNGVKWFDRIYGLVERSKETMKTGGIARDWSFGFTPLLTRFGRNISAEIGLHGGRVMSAELPSRIKIVQQMIDALGGNGRRNVAVVGPNGAGKTSVVHDLAEKLIDASSNVPKGLKFSQVFLMDSAALIAAANKPGEIEVLMTQLFNEAYAAKNIVLCLDDAQLFFGSDVGSVDITNLLLPVLQAGNLRLVLTLNEQKMLEITAKNPAVLNALNRINIAEASQEETLAAMEDRAVQLEHMNGVIYAYQALKEAYRLSQKYIYDLGMPGRAIKLLESAAGYPDPEFTGVKYITAESVANAVEGTLGVKVGTANTNAERDKLLNLEDAIHARMINQTKAVRVVADALRRARTGVRNDKKPIGTFLFLGPTGVGKTELAKSLAAIYFGSDENMVRMDMNQYALAENVNDLTADGADNPTSLTAQMMKRPFSVVLLDEIEKAHPAVLAALLQVLDEGVLRDARGREVGFRDAIIIATSNAGAERIRVLVSAGRDLAESEEQFVNELIDSGQFRPEFLNRFDEIVLFKPLGHEELLQVADLLIAGVNKTLAPQKITVAVEPEAKELLVLAGYDPRLGARPMRRVVQRTLESEVSKRILAGQAGPGDRLVIASAEMEELLNGQA